jgi:Spy/CpxP family protein refolding chaperone
MILTNKFIFIGSAVIALALSAVPADAQGRRGGARGGGGRGATFTPDEQGTLLLLSALLDLNDSQRQEVRAVFDTAAKTAAPIAAQTTTSRDALFQAVKSGASDDQIKTLADQQGSRTSQILVLQAQTFANVWSLLTDQQRSRVDVSMYVDIGAFLSSPPPPVPAASIGAPPGGPGN